MYSGDELYGDDVTSGRPDGEPVARECHHYRVVRFYFNRPGHRRTILTGLTLAEAQAHCSDPETSSSTAMSPSARRRTREQGPWFDGYDAD
jgi:hypothetical protein